MKRYVVAALGVGLFVLLLLIPRLLPINILECRSQYGPCDSQLQTDLNKIEGKNYLTAKKETIKILSSSKYIGQSSVRFNLPDKLIVDVIEKKPSIAFPSENGFYLTNQFGQVVGEVSETLLPKIYSDEGFWKFEVGQELTEDLKFAIKIMQKIYYVYNLSEAHVKNDSLSFTLSDGKQVIFPLTGDIDVLFGSLQVILSRLQGESNYSIIDLRFKNPVLR